RRPLARTSAAPGKTRLANFYRVQRGSAPPLYLVDLPGYGYARGGDASAHEFNRLADAYFARGLAGSGPGDLNRGDQDRGGQSGDRAPGHRESGTRDSGRGTGSGPS